MVSPLPDSAIVDNLATALANARKFQEQSADRINSMKLEVLHTYKAQENVSGNVPAKDSNKYDQNITSRIIHVVEGRAAALEEFRKQQEAAEKTLSGLQTQLENEKSSTSDQTGQDLEIKHERDRILEHVSRIQTFRKEQVEAEGLLNKFLQLKKQAQSQDRDALRISQEIKIMESKLDGFSMDDSPPQQPAVQTGGGHDQAEALRRSAHQTSNPELQRFMFNDLPPPNAPCVVLGDVVSPQGVAFRAGDQVQFLRAGNKGWTLVRDGSGVPSWLPAFEVQALHTNQGVLDYREVQRNGGAEAVQTRTNFLNDPGSGPSSAGAPHLESPIPMQGALHGFNGPSPPRQSPPQEFQPTSSSPRPLMGQISLSLSPGSDASAPAGHTGVVGLALSCGPNDGIVVAAVKPGGPASKSQKIQVGQTVTSIDGEEVARIGDGGKGDLAAVVKKLCGPAGSFVSVGLLRADGREVEVVLVREEPQWVRASRDHTSRAGSRAGSPPHAVTASAPGLGATSHPHINLDGHAGAHLGLGGPPARAPSPQGQSLSLTAGPPAGGMANLNSPNWQASPGPVLRVPQAVSRDPLATASGHPARVPGFFSPGPGPLGSHGGARPSPPPTPPRRQPLWSANSFGGPPNLSGAPSSAGFTPRPGQWAGGAAQLQGDHGMALGGMFSPVLEPADPPISPVSSPLVPPDMDGSPSKQHWQNANGQINRASGPAVPGRGNLNVNGANAAAAGLYSSPQADVNKAPWLAAPGVSPILVDSPMTQHATASPGMASSPMPLGAPAVPAFPNMVGGAHVPSMPPMLHITPEIADHVPSVPGWGFPEARNGGRVAMSVVNGGLHAATPPGIASKSSGHFI